MTARTLRHLIRPYLGGLGLIALLSVARSALLLVVPWLAASALGKVFADAEIDLHYSVLVLLLLLAAIAVMDASIAIVSGTVSLRVRRDVNQRVHEQLQRLPSAFHDAHPKGDLLALAGYEVRRLTGFLTVTMASFPSQLLMVIGSAILMYRLDPRLGLVVPVLVPIFYLSLKLIRRRLRNIAHQIRLAEAQIVAHDHETLEMLPVNKAFGRESIEDRRHSALLHRIVQHASAELRIQGLISPLIGLLAAAAALIVIAAAGNSVLSGSMNATQLLGLMFYAALLTRPISSLAHIYGHSQSAIGTLARLERVLNEPREPGRDLPADGFRGDGDIRFDQVGFSYSRERGPVFEDLSFTIPEGSFAALVGPNGSGKTTIANLLLRFYDADSGQITIGEREIRSVNLDELRESIGLVSQLTLVADGTIADVLRFGGEHATHTEIERAARLAQAHQFIVGLPEGYNTRVGEQGLRLSGGERQKLALARALVRDPKILILDEATSMFDRDAEDAFLLQSSAAFAGRTVLMISHRPEPLKRADITIQLDSRPKVSRLRACPPIYSTPLPHSAVPDAASN